MRIEEHKYLIKPFKITPNIFFAHFPPLLSLYGSTSKIQLPEQYSEPQEIDEFLIGKLFLALSVLVVWTLPVCSLASIRLGPVKHLSLMLCIISASALSLQELGFAIKAHVSDERILLMLHLLPLSECFCLLSSTWTLVVFFELLVIYLFSPLLMLFGFRVSDR